CPDTKQENDSGYTKIDEAEVLPVAKSAGTRGEKPRWKVLSQILLCTTLWWTMAIL
ncbi:unnamed protein product, partial [Polarella glacialis]